MSTFPGVLDNVWRHTWLSKWGKQGLLVSSMVLSTLQCTNSLPIPTKIAPAPNAGQQWSDARWGTTAVDYNRLLLRPKSSSQSQRITTVPRAMIRAVC